MMTQQQILERYNQLFNQYPEAFKKPRLLYGLIPVHGALDEWKEFLPWLIAGIIFIPSVYLLHVYLLHEVGNFLSYAIGILFITLCFMLISPFIIYQIRHSSTHLYQSIKNIPLRITILIILQAINIKFLESSLLLSALFFFSISYGFIGLIKENLFKPHTSSQVLVQLRHIRQACFSSHLQVVKISLKMKFYKKSSAYYPHLQQQRNTAIQTHQTLQKFEKALYQNLKYINLETYIDELMK
ncbi:MULTISPECIES: hypothetical protein [unclassified Acinetobacter]|uniref:hypothetical protein n=1 Tax=unclassified Acinetobacter TaxID=196816 RepID=UPI002934B3BA|nr:MULTISPECIES: hypothetical protein [unclassified Acinetobacter]WOE31431.1 hypothetical protein QSG84_14120 [Acinetobacter sp. SAAs470]WOE39627.1 hypothetical protein QSG86_07785 [Acinetobacter sp. SAAs474]